MFQIFTNADENNAASTSEQDEQHVSLEALEGDSALIQAVNELNQLKSPKKTAG